MGELERERLRKAGRASSLGWELGGAIIGGLLAGYFLDKWLGTAPWLALVGICLGSVAGFYNLWKFARDSAKDDEDQNR